MPDELPEKWGLIELGAKLRVKVKASKQERDLLPEFLLMTSLVRRLGVDAKEGISVRIYKHETQNNASVSLEVKEDES